MNLVQTQDERDLLAEALGDTPETVIPAGLLLAGLADAYVCGEAPRFEGVVVQSHLLRREPWASGATPLQCGHCCVRSTTGAGRPCPRTCRQTWRPEWQP